MRQWSVLYHPWLPGQRLFRHESHHQKDQNSIRPLPAPHPDVPERLPSLLLRHTRTSPSDDPNLWLQSQVLPPFSVHDPDSPALLFHMDTARMLLPVRFGSGCFPEGFSAAVLHTLSLLPVIPSSVLPCFLVFLYTSYTRNFMLFLYFRQPILSLSHIL